MNSIVKHYDEPKINLKEIARYLGYGSLNEEITALLCSCLKEAQPFLEYKVCFTELPIKICRNSCDFFYIKVISENLSQNLSGCDRAILFAATVGAKLDRLILKYSRISPSKAVIFQAIGAERIEALCDLFSKDIADQLNVEIKPRFSPGYGDLPLSVQKDIFKVLDCSNSIGISLNNSMLISPSKSVTAFMGIK